MRAAIVCLLMIACSAAFAASKKSVDSLSAPAVAQQIKTSGAKATMETLNSGADRRKWDIVLGRIKSGKPEWLDIAKGLSRGMDAPTSSELRNALANALIKNPGGVLRISDEEAITIDYLCAASFTDRSFLHRYLQEAQRALRNLKAPDVNSRRLACLNKIEQAVQVQKALEGTAPPKAAEKKK